MLDCVAQSLHAPVGAASVDLRHDVDVPEQVVDRHVCEPPKTFFGAMCVFVAHPRTLLSVGELVAEGWVGVVQRHESWLHVQRFRFEPCLVHTDELGRGRPVVRGRGAPRLVDCKTWACPVTVWTNLRQVHASRAGPQCQRWAAQQPRAAG